ncbi:MAG: FHA domain-containing protein [Desulfarculus sp.]|nr:FHA domain-containing protein [Desulfarculus sp.]
MIRLTVSRDGRNIELRVLEPGSYTLGRSPDSDLVLDDPAVAESQLRLTVSAHGVMIEDLAGGQGQLSGQRPLPLGPFVLDWQTAETEAGAQTRVAPAPEPPPPAGLAGQPPGGVLAQLRVLSGEQTGQVFSLGPGISLVGRAPECAVRLADPSVSRRHAEISVDGQGFSVRDLGSTSGTLLEGRSIEQARLAPGQSLSFGTVTIELLPPLSGPDDTRAKASPLAAQEPESPPAPAGQPAAAGSSARRRLLLYGEAAVALALLALALVFGGGDKGKPGQVSQAVQQRQQSEQEEQRQRLVVINLTKGKQALEAGAHAEAAQFLRNVITADPGHEEARRLLEQAQQALAQAESQRASLERQETLRRQRRDDLWRQARAAQEREDYARVRELAGQALEVDPNDALARHLILQAQAAQEQKERQRLEAAETVRQREAQAQELYRQGLAKLEKKSLILARQDLEQALALDSENVFAVTAQARQALERLEQASLKKADELAALGAKQHKAGRLNEALAAYRQALQLQPEHPQAKAGLARARQEAERQAVRLAQEADVLEGLGKRGPACAKWRQALQLTTEDGALHKEIKEKLPLCR